MKSSSQLACHTTPTLTVGSKDQHLTITEYKAAHTILGGNWKRIQQRWANTFNLRIRAPPPPPAAPPAAADQAPAEEGEEEVAGSCANTAAEAGIFAPCAIKGDCTRYGPFCLQVASEAMAPMWHHGTIVAPRPPPKTKKQLLENIKNLVLRTF